MKLTKVSKMKKVQPKKKENNKNKLHQNTERLFNHQQITKFMTECEDYRSLLSIANMKFSESSKFITDRQKELITKIQIQKRLYQMQHQKFLQQMGKIKDEFQNQQKQANPKLQQLSQLVEVQEREINKQQIFHQFVQKKQTQQDQELSRLKKYQQIMQARHKFLQQQKLQIQRQHQKMDQKIQKVGLQIIELQKESREVFEQKKRENNILQELKGNIRVYCRIRPAHNERIEYEINDNLIKLKRDKTELKYKNRVEEYEYLFEKIFAQDTPQSDVFHELTELVQCSVDGKNVCIFAYGQTGSGKTHTMTGSLDQYRHQLRGFIPRSIEYIFDQVQISKQNGYEAKISVSICEVYNDKIFDLVSLSSEKCANLEPKQKDLSEKFPKTNNTMGFQKNLSRQKSIEDLFQVVVKNPEEALLAMTNALKRRTTAQTKMNTSSSRSHLIFEIRNQFYNPNTKVSRCSSLVLVDLAGSERQKDSGVTGMRLQEAKSINNSLTELGKVMRAIKNEELPSFRNCKLTMILQKYLQSDSKAVMFVNVSPDKKDLDQTINSLVFAESVRQCKIKQNKNIKTPQKRF